VATNPKKRCGKRWGEDTKAAFAIDVARGYSVAKLVEKHGVSAQTSRNWRRQDWCKELVLEFKATAVQAAKDRMATLVVEAMDFYGWLLVQRPDPEEARGLETMRKAAHDVLQTAGVVGVEVASPAQSPAVVIYTTEVRQGVYQTESSNGDHPEPGVEATASPPGPGAGLERLPLPRGEAP